MNRGLAADLPKALRRRRYPLAIDLTLIPYHGEPYLSPAEVYRGEPKSGTSHFHAYATAYVIRDGRRFTVGICVVYGRFGRRGRRRRLRALVYAYWGFHPPSCDWVRETYRTRFAIETTYRQMNQARIRTCTRDPLLRLLFVGLALLLRNVWVWLHLMCLAVARRGRVELHLEQLRIRRMLTWLQHYAEKLFGFHDFTVAERPMPP